jgi:hypothetical protein
VLKIGFRTEDEDESPWFLEVPDFFAEGWWAFEKRSDVALGMAGGRELSFRTVHFTPRLVLKATHDASYVVCWGSHQGWIHEKDSYSYGVSLGN